MDDVKAPTAWQWARFGDSEETRVALAYWRDRGWPVDDSSRCPDERIDSFKAGYRAALAAPRPSGELYRPGIASLTPAPIRFVDEEPLIDDEPARPSGEREAPADLVALVTEWQEAYLAFGHKGETAETSSNLGAAEAALMAWSPDAVGPDAAAGQCRTCGEFSSAGIAALRHALWNLAGTVVAMVDDPNERRGQHARSVALSETSPFVDAARDAIRQFGLSNETAAAPRPSGEREAPASGERPEIEVGDWVLEDERDATPCVVRADNVGYWNEPGIVVTLLEIRKPNGVVWRRS